jgi:GNAT superfamily N-acetyltransferase
VLPAVAALVGADLAADLDANPDTTADTPCLFCLVDADGRAVSWIRVWADHLFINGQMIPWLWTGNLHTVPELRGRGLATHLQREGTEWTMARGMGRGSVFSTEETLHIYKKLGYLLPGYASRRVLVRAVRPVVAGHVASKRLGAIIAGVLQPVAGLAGRAVAARCRSWAAGSTAVVQNHSGGDRVKATIDAAARLMPVRFNLSPAKLQWKIDWASRKGGECSVIAIAGDQGEPLALAVTRTRMETKPLANRYRDFRCTTLMDFLLAERSERAARALLAHTALHFFESSGGEVLQLISYHPALTALSAKLGFIRAGRGMSFACRLPPDAARQDAADAISAWPVTHFSGDAPFF